LNRVCAPNNIIINAFENEICNSKDEYYKIKIPFKLNPLLKPLSEMKEYTLDELMKYIDGNNDINNYIKLKIASLLQIKSERYVINF